MNKLLITITLLVTVTINARSQEADSLDFSVLFDSIEQTFTYRHGMIELENGIGIIEVPQGFKYLDAAQSERVLTEIWGNPKGANISLGMLFPEHTGVMTSGSFVFNIQYDELGYVKDGDADDINYDDLLKEMQEEAQQANAERIKEGYDPIKIVGWAARPMYDEANKVLYWAKEIKFGDAETNTLNYNVRVLGRKGVMVLNAIAEMDALPEVNKEIPQVLGSFKFTKGNQYGDFNPDVDQVAAWTIGGLVAGKILAKVGFFAVLLKFWKVIGLAIIAGGTALWKRIRGRKKDEEDDADAGEIQPVTIAAAPTEEKNEGPVPPVQ